MRGLFRLLEECVDRSIFPWTPYVGRTRVVQKVLPHIFFPEYIYSKWLKFGDNINEYFFYTHYFSS
jgi:hypothetical protein